MEYEAAIVGAGLMGHWHAHAARSMGVKIVAIVDPDPKKCHEVAVAAKADHECRNLSDLFAIRTVYAVHICTPLNTHYELCRLALESGANVLCEKPLAPREGDIESLYAIASKQQRRLWIVHQFPWQRGAGNAIRSLNKIGKLVRVEFLFCSAGGEGGDEAYLDDIVADILPHPLSLIPYLLPDCEVAHLKWTAEKNRSGELNATTIIGETRISIVISLSIRPTECTMILRGESGSWHIDFYHGYSWYESGSVSRFFKLIAPFRRSVLLFFHASSNLMRRIIRRQYAYPGLNELMREFYTNAAHTDNAADLKRALAISTARGAIIERAGRLSTRMSE